MTTDIIVTSFIAYLLVGIYGKNSYVAQFTSEVVACEGFTNEYLDCSGLKLSETQTDEGNYACGLSGQMNLLEKVDSRHVMLIEIWKTLPCDKELMWGVRSKVCDSIDQTDAPWYCLVEAMNITGCPIVGGTYNIKNLVVDLSFMDEFMNYQFCGEYIVEMQILEDIKPVVCYKIELSIEEID